MVLNVREGNGALHEGSEPHEGRRSTSGLEGPRCRSKAGLRRERSREGLKENGRARMGAPPEAECMRTGNAVAVESITEPLRGGCGTAEREGSRRGMKATGRHERSRVDARTGPQEGTSWPCSLRACLSPFSAGKSRIPEICGKAGNGRNDDRLEVNEKRFAIP